MNESLDQSIMKINYRSDYYAKCPQNNPQGRADNYNPNELNAVKRVQRGGSF